jgi:hypothetical protein
LDRHFAPRSPPLSLKPGVETSLRAV